MFSLQVGHCVYWLYIIILIIIIIVVVHDYDYLSSLLAEDWHFEICLSLDAVVEKKNKLLLLILFHKSLDSEILYPLFPILFLTLVFVCPSLKWTLVLFVSFGIFLSLVVRVLASLPGKCSKRGLMEDERTGLLHMPIVTRI